MYREATAIKPLYRTKAGTVIHVGTRLIAISTDKHAYDERRLGPTCDLNPQNHGSRSPLGILRSLRYPDSMHEGWEPQSENSRGLNVYL